MSRGSPACGPTLAVRVLLLIAGVLSGVALVFILKSINVQSPVASVSTSVSSAARAQLGLTSKGLVFTPSAHSADERVERVASALVSAPLMPQPEERVASALVSAPLMPQPAIEEADPHEGAAPALSSPKLSSPSAILSRHKEADPHEGAAPAPSSPSLSSPLLLQKYVSGGKVWPAGSASSYPWDSAEGKLHQMPERLIGLQETIWSRARSKPCGDPCVAHCIAGQPRDILSNVGLWKAYKHRLFEKFSDSPVVFVVYAASPFLGGGAGDGYAGYVRTPVQAASDKQMVKGFEYMEVDRALIIREPCTTGDCLAKGAGLTCVARTLKLTAQYDRRTKNVSNFCDVQVRRFQTCMHLVREYEQDHHINIAWVARDRPDVYFAEPAARYTKLRTDTVYFKPWAPCGFGGMDWWYVMPRHHADTLARFPDDMKCEYLLHPLVQPVCRDCIGCECFLAAWMYSQKVKFERFPPPWDGFIPLKFCGPGCVNDWKVTEESICRGFCKGRKSIPDAKIIDAKGRQHT